MCPSCIERGACVRLHLCLAVFVLVVEDGFITGGADGIIGLFHASFRAPFTLVRLVVGARVSSSQPRHLFPPSFRRLTPPVSLQATSLSSDDILGISLFPVPAGSPQSISIAFRGSLAVLDLQAATAPPAAVCSH